MTGLTAEDFEILLNGTGSRRDRKQPRPSGKWMWPFMQVYHAADASDARIMARRIDPVWRWTQSLAAARLARRRFNPSELVQA